MDSSPIASYNMVTRSASEDGSRVSSTNRTGGGGLSSNVQNISSSLDSWKERRKLKMSARGQLGSSDVFTDRQVDSYPVEKRGRGRLAPLASCEDDDGDDDETGATDAPLDSTKRRRPHELTLRENVPSSTRGNDRNSISSHNISSNQRSSSNTSSSGVSPYLSTSPASPSSRLLHLHEWEEKTEESKGRNRERGGKSAAKEGEEASIDIRTSQTIDKSPRIVVPRSGGAELASSSSPFLRRSHQQQLPCSPVSPCGSLSPLLSPTRSVSATSPTHSGYGGGSSDSDISHRAAGDGGEEVEGLSRRKRATVTITTTSESLIIGKDDDAHTEDRGYHRNNNSKASEDTNGDEKDNYTRDVNDDGVGRREHHQQKIILTQNSEDDEMWNVDFTAIEATETLNNEHARQKLLLRRKSSLAQKHRPSRVVRKRFSESESESESSNLNVEPVTSETKKNREIYRVDLPKADEYKRSAETSPKIRNEISEVPLQNVQRERRDPGLQLKKEKDQENRAVLDTSTPVVLRKNSYNSFDNTAGSRKPLIQEISSEGGKSSNPERISPFVNLRRTPRRQELLRGSKGPQSLEDISDKVDTPQFGSENYNNRQKNSDLRKETNRNSFPIAETPPRVLRSLARVDRRGFEDGPKSTISTTDDDWLKKRHSTGPIIVPVPQKDSPVSNAGFKGEEKPEKWSVIRQPLDPETDNRNTLLASEKPTWLKKNLDARRTNSYHFTPPTKESDSDETQQEAPWVKEFRNSRKRVGRIFNKSDPVKPLSDKPSPPLIETPPPSVRISKPLSSLVTSEQSIRGVISTNVALNANPSPITAEKKETPSILPEVSVTPRYRVERKASFNNIHEGGISSSMKENRSPVSRNSINTTEPYLPSWSVADAGEAPASLADTRGEVPEWQRKLAEKNKLKKQSFRRTKSEGSELYEHDYEIDTTIPVDTVLYYGKENIPKMYSQNNAPPGGGGLPSSTSVPDINAYQGQWYPQGQYFEGGYDANYYYGYGSNMSYSTSYINAPSDYQQNVDYQQSQHGPLTKAYSYDSLSQYDDQLAPKPDISRTKSPKRSPKFGDMSLSPERQPADNRSPSPTSPTSPSRFIQVLPTSNGASPANSPRRSVRSDMNSPISSRNSSPFSHRSSRRPSSNEEEDEEEEEVHSPVKQKSSSSTHKGLPTFSLSNAESHSSGRKSRYSNKPMYVRVLPLPQASLPNKLSPKKKREYTDLSPTNSPSKIPVPLKSPNKEPSFKDRFFGKKERNLSNASVVSDETEKKSKAKYRFKNLTSPKFSPFRKKDKTPKQNQSDEEESTNGPSSPQPRSEGVIEGRSGKPPAGPEAGPYYRILRSPLKTKSLPSRSYSMPDPPGNMLEQRAKLRPVARVEEYEPPKPESPEKIKQTLKRGRRIEDSSSPKVQTEDGGGTSTKPQPAWKIQLKNRTTSVDQAEKKSPEKPDWIKQAEERRARLAKTKLLEGGGE